MSESLLFDDAAIAQALHELAEQIRQKKLQRMAIVGIRTGGAAVAAALRDLLLDLAPDFGLLDITLYRDDALAQGANARLLGTDLPFDVDGRELVLVDDVLFTGRTVRAAMAAICDLGRPKRVYLCALIDRGGRELPIAADFVGFHVEADGAERVVLRTEQELPKDVLLEPNRALSSR
ncbi:MAG: bifunctional pyr operon transcriptional regulator/uracil phosphoribosyltransferase PyrR [Deltaproteobacteria bacterium]|nr:bifunctional pyr operon transcriptional regulator/uracil phosphoribosyltransferase PyrR [Deltaproteobacteria bacterium]